jgi:DNA (cytosine-5)-methyltransferase 3A
MKVLSLFDGIAGCRQALKELNIDCEYYASEIDKYAIQIAKANHPDINHIGDVKNIYTDYTGKSPWQILRWGENEDMRYTSSRPPSHEESEFDLLIGGSPCQDLSIAKKNRKGLQGDRSSLFYEYLRILNEVKPKYFILENVASMSKESKEIITKELFNIDPVMINSGLLTAQNRKRLYWVGKLVNGEYEQVKIGQPEDKKIYLKDIIEKNVDEKYYIKLNQNQQQKYNKIKTDTEKLNCLTEAIGRGGSSSEFLTSCKKITNIAHRVGHFNKGGQGDRVYSVDGKSVCLSANGGGRGAKTGLYDIDKVIRKLTPTECCRLQGFPDNYVSIVSNTQAYKALGNSFTVPVIKHILTNLK